MNRTDQELHDEYDGEVGRQEAHAAPFAGDAHDRLPDEGQVDESAVGVAKGKAEQLGNEAVLVLGCRAVVLEI